MINRVQAFSNINNYNQNFGMAVVKKPGADLALQRISKKWDQLMGIEDTQGVLNGVAKLRKQDTRCNIVISPLDAEKDGIQVALHSTESGIRVKQSVDGKEIPSYNFTSESDPVQFENALCDLSDFATMYEREPLGQNLLKDIPLVK